MSVSLLYVALSIFLDAQELRGLAPLPHSEICGALGRVASMQEDLAEIVKGHLLVERSSSRGWASKLYLQFLLLLKLSYI